MMLTLVFVALSGAPPEEGLDDVRVQKAQQSQKLDMLQEVLKYCKPCPAPRKCPEQETVVLPCSVPPQESQTPTPQPQPEARRGLPTWAQYAIPIGAFVLGIAAGIGIGVGASK